MLEIQLHVWVFKLHMVMMLRPETYYMYYYSVLGNENQKPGEDPFVFKKSRKHSYLIFEVM